MASTDAATTQTQILAVYRVTVAPYVGHMFTTPVTVDSPRLGDVARRIAADLGVEWENVNVYRIEALEDWDERCVRLTGELPTDSPTVALAPGIYRRAIVTSPNLRETSYTLRWVRAIDKGIVYSITRKSAFSFETETMIENATFTDVKGWLRNRGLIIAPPASQD